MKRKRYRLTDEERETIQLLHGCISVTRLARAIRCDRRTVRYWQVTKDGKSGPVFVRPRGMFAKWAAEDTDGR
jgi:hypothetical protein